MERAIKLSLLVALFVGVGLSSMAQPEPQPPVPGDEPIMEQENGPGKDFQGGPGMRPMRPGMKGPGKMDPEMEKLHNQKASLMAMAEAHKELAKIYEQQNKIDESAAELKKIITLASEGMGTIGSDPGMKRQIMGKIIPVYHEIARLYMKNNRMADAEKVINEGIALFEKDEPAAATKLILHLGEIHKQNNDLKKAEETFKRVIELNQKNIK